MDSIINRVIKENGLKAGDTMKDVRGDDIPDSVVLGDYTVLIKDGKCYNLRAENVLTGEETVIRIWPEGMAALKAMTF